MPFRLPWQKPPAPVTVSPLQTYDVRYVLTVVALWCAYTLLCVAFKLGYLGTLQPHHAKRTWLCFAFTVAVQAVSGFDTTNADYLEAFEGKKLDSFLLLYLGARLMPIAAFGMLLTSEMSVRAAPGPAGGAALLVVA